MIFGQCCSIGINRKNAQRFFQLGLGKAIVKDTPDPVRQLFGQHPRIVVRDAVAGYLFVLLQPGTDFGAPVGDAAIFSVVVIHNGRNGVHVEPDAAGAEERADTVQVLQEEALGGGKGLPGPRSSPLVLPRWPDSAGKNKHSPLRPDRAAIFSPVLTSSGW